MLRTLRAVLPLFLSAVTAGFFALMPAAADAANPAEIIAPVNLRAGPSVGYPVVAGLPGRAAVTVYGCTANVAWCDVSWGRERGWVAANYVQIMYRGAPVIVTPAVAPVIGVVAFNQAYWHSYYVGRPWYGQWNTYYHGAAVAGPGHVAFGGCGRYGCSGTSIARGPYGGVVVHHGFFGRY